MLGDTAVAVHPDDERYKKLVGKNVILPLVGRKIPIIADEYSDPEKGSGAVKITPAHDFNDFEVGKRHNLPQINIFSTEAKLSSQETMTTFLAGVRRHRAISTRRWRLRRHRSLCRAQDRSSSGWRRGPGRKDRAA